MLDLLTVLLVLLPLEPLPAKAPAALRQSLARVACWLDLAAESEGWGGTSYAHEVRWVRHAFWELAGTPPSSDSARFPPVWVCDQAQDAASSYRDHLTAQQLFFSSQAGRWLPLLREADQLAHVWAAARWAQTGGVAYRRRALAALRDRLGPAQYAAGELPPPVPVWRLERRD